MRRLAKKYDYLQVPLDSKASNAAYQLTRTFQRELDHPNVRKLHNFFTTPTPFLPRYGHLYLEKVDCSLRESISHPNLSHVSLPVTKLTRDLLGGVSFLHTRDPPISHGKLSIDSVFIQLDPTNRVWNLK